MNMSLRQYREEYLELLLRYLWRAWTALGAAGQVQVSVRHAIDPEALLLFTCFSCLSHGGRISKSCCVLPLSFRRSGPVRTVGVVGPQGAVHVNPRFHRAHLILSERNVFVIRIAKDFP